MFAISPGVARYQKRRAEVQAEILLRQARTPRRPKGAQPGLSLEPCWSCNSSGMDEDRSGYPGDPTRSRYLPRLCPHCKGYSRCWVQRDPIKGPK